MALFKIYKGEKFPETGQIIKATEGFAYFTSDDGKFYIDISGDGTGDAVIRSPEHPLGNRIPLNAAQADYVKNNFILKISNGNIENNNLYTFNGSETKQLNIIANNGINFTSAQNSLTIGIDASAINTGILPTAYGGTGNDAYVANRLIYSETANKLNSIDNIGADGNTLSFLKDDQDYSLITNKYNNVIYPLLRDHHNGNISLSASSGGLYVGYANTQFTSISQRVKIYPLHSFKESTAISEPGWIRIASLQLNDNNHFGQAVLDFTITRSYNSLAPETYTVRVTAGWQTCTITQVGGSINKQRLSEFRVVRDDVEHKAYFEVYLNATPTNNTIYISAIDYTNKTALEFLSEPETKLDSELVLYKVIKLKTAAISSNKSLYISDIKQGLFLTDSSNSLYGAIFNNDNNLWIGATATNENVHTGNLYFHAGKNASGIINRSAFLAIGDNDTATTATNYIIVYGSGGSPSQPVYVDTYGKIQSITGALSNNITGNANTATAFASNATISLTGDITGSANGTHEWSINTTIGTGKVTNAMLAGSITNNKLVNSTIGIAGTNIALGSSIDKTTLLSNLGLTNAAHYIGKATKELTDGGTENPTISGYDFANDRKSGDIVLGKDGDKEYIWGLNGWELLGPVDTIQTSTATGTKNRLAYYSAANMISSGDSIYADTSHLTINGTTIPANSGNFQVIGISTMRDIIPEEDSKYHLGNTANHWVAGYTNTFYISSDINFKYVAKNGDIAAHYEGDGIYLNKNDLRIYQADNTISARLYLNTLGTVDTAGVSMLTLGNSIVTENINNSSGTLRLYSPDQGYMSIKASTVVRNHLHYLPIYSTATSTSSSVYYGRLVGIYKSTTVGDNDFEDVGSTSQPVYVTANGVIKAVSLKPTLNNLLSSLTDGTADALVDAGYFTSTNNNGATDDWYLRSNVAIWNYIKGKYSSTDTTLNTGPIHIRSTTGNNNALIFDRASGTYQYIQSKNPDNNISIVFAESNSDENTTYRFTKDEFYPKTNNSKNLGLSGNKWANVYATNFNGALKGNADTATKWTAAQKVYVTLGTADTTTTIQGGSTSAQTIGVDGTLGTAHGGTGNTSYTASRLVYTNTATKFATGTIESDGNNIILGDGDYSLSRTAQSGNWNQGVSKALIKITSATGAYPLFAMKSHSGHWLMTQYESSNFYDHLMFGFLSDVDVYGVTNAKNHYDYKVRLIPTIYETNTETVTDRAFVTANYANDSAQTGNTNQPIYIDNQGVATAVSLKPTLNNLLSSLTEGTADALVDAGYIISTNNNGATNDWYLRSNVTIWNYIKNHITNDLYWANIKVQDSSKTDTIPTFKTIYFGSVDPTTSGRGILTFSSTYPNHGLWYFNDSTDVITLDGQGKANSKTEADLAINALGAGIISTRNRYIPHTGNTTGTVGTKTRPVYVNAGTITQGDFELKATVNASENANRAAYYSGTNTIEDAGSIYMTASTLGVNQTSITSGQTFEVTGKAHIANTTSNNGTTATPPAFSVGTLTGTNIGISPTGIQAKNNATTSTLNLNYYGGPIIIGQSSTPVITTHYGSLIIDRTDYKYETSLAGETIALIRMKYNNANATSPDTYDKYILTAIKTTETSNVDASTILLSSGGGNLVLSAGENNNDGAFLKKNGIFKYGSESMILTSDGTIEIFTGTHNSNGSFTAHTKIDSFGIRGYYPDSNFNRTIQPSAVIEKGLFLYSFTTNTDKVDTNTFVAGTYYHIDKTSGNKIYYAASLYNNNNTFKSLSLRNPYENTDVYLTWTDGKVGNSIYPWQTDTYVVGSTSLRWQHYYGTRSIDLEYAGETGLEVNNTAKTHKVAFISGSSGNAGIYDRTHGYYLIKSDQTNGDTTISANTSKNILFVRGNSSPVENARFNASGHFIPGANNTFSLGLTETRWTSGFFTTSLRVGAINTTTGTTSTTRSVYIGPDGFYANSVDVTSAAQSNFVLRGKGIDYAKLYIEILGVADTAGRATLTLGNSAASTAANNAYGKLVLYSWTTKYSSIESSADIKGQHLNYLPIYNETGTSTYYGRLVGIYKGTSGGSTSGFSDVGSTSQPVYVTANGVVKPITGAIANNTTGNAATATAANITSTDNAIVRFDGTAGKFQNSTVIIDDNGYINSKQFKTSSSETILNDVGYITIYPYDRKTYGNTTPTPARFIFTEKAYTTGVPAKTLMAWSGIDNIKINNFIGALKGNADTATAANITSTDNAIVRFDGTAGKFQNSQAFVDDNGGIQGVSLGVAQTDGEAGYGLSLYGGPKADKPTYGMMFAHTSKYGTHGEGKYGVTHTWATYLTMDNTVNRGWIFQRGTTNVASINGYGTLQLGVKDTAIERRVQVNSGSGDIYLYAAAATTGLRGIYTHDTDNNGEYVIAINQDNNISQLAKFAISPTPSVTNTYSLGVSGTCWKAAFIGTADSYGSATNPIYWSNGVPVATNTFLTTELVYYCNKVVATLYYVTTSITVDNSSNCWIYGTITGTKGTDSSAGMNVRFQVYWNKSTFSAAYYQDSTNAISEMTFYTDSNGKVYLSFACAVRYSVARITVLMNSAVGNANYATAVSTTAPATFSITKAATKTFEALNTSGVTAGTYGPTANVTGTEGTTIKVPQITVDAYGRVTSVTERTLTNKNTTYTIPAAANTTTAVAAADSNTQGTAKTWARSDHNHHLPTSGVTAGSYGPSANATPGYGVTFNVPYITVDKYGRVTAASTKTVKIPASDNTNTDTKVNYKLDTTTKKAYVMACTSAPTATATARESVGSTSVYINCSTNVLMGAAWNDYAEFRQLKENKMYATTVGPGRVVYENGDDTLSISTERLMRGCNIVSDTYGFSIGESKKAQLPIAVSGRVLAYPYENKEEFKNHIGWPVCSGPNGTVSIMTEEEEMKYPSRIIGTISAVPDYEIWHGGADVIVDGRVWIKVR